MKRILVYLVGIIAFVSYAKEICNSCSFVLSVISIIFAAMFIGVTTDFVANYVEEDK